MYNMEYSASFQTINVWWTLLHLLTVITTISVMKCCAGWPTCIHILDSQSTFFAPRRQKKNATSVCFVITLKAHWERILKCIVSKTNFTKWFSSQIVKITKKHYNKRHTLKVHLLLFFSPFLHSPVPWECVRIYLIFVVTVWILTSKNLQ